MQSMWDWMQTKRMAAQLSTAIIVLCKMRSSAIPIKLEVYHTKASGWLRNLKNIFQFPSLQAIWQMLSKTAVQPSPEGVQSTNHWIPEWKNNRQKTDRSHCYPVNPTTVRGQRLFLCGSGRKQHIWYPGQVNLVSIHFSLILYGKV